MRLYPKQLKNVSELKKEQALLKSELKQHDIGGILQSKPANKPEAKKEDGDILSAISSFFFTNPFADIALKLAFPILKGPTKKAGKSAFKIAKEVLGGYAKWKALEIGYRWIRRRAAKKKEERS